MKTAIFAPEIQYSETFILDHIARMPGETIPILGTWPRLIAEGLRVFPRVLEFGSLERNWTPKMLSRGSRASMTSRLGRFLKARRVDVALAEYATSAFPLVDACGSARIPLVVHFHGFDIYTKAFLEQNAESYRRLFASAAAFIAGSRDMLAHALSVGVPEGKLHYNPCGVDGSQFSPIQAGTNPPRIVSVGRFVDKKAPYLTILAFQAAKEKCPNAQLAMAGDGPALETCKQIVRACGLTDSVTFLGRQSREQVSALLKSGRAFAQHSVQTSNGDSEGTAISILEASATGLPVVATAHAGIKDTMVAGETALLCEEGDIAAMAGHMATLLNDPELATKMGGAGRARTVEHFSMEKSIAGIYRILESAVRSC